MSEKEDYLDQLLNSMKEPQSHSEKKKRDNTQTHREAFSMELDEGELSHGESFYAEFDNEMDEEASDIFLDEFESELDEIPRETENVSNEIEEDDIFAGLSKVMKMPKNKKEKKGRRKSSKKEEAPLPEETKETKDETLISKSTNEEVSLDAMLDSVRMEEPIYPEQEEPAPEDEKQEVEEEDVLNLLTELSNEDDELSDIAQMLKAQDTKEDIPMDEEEDELGFGEVIPLLDLPEDEFGVKEGSKEVNEMQELLGKQEGSASKDKKEKKKKNGIISKLGTLFFGEEEELIDELSEESLLNPEQELLSDENSDILSELEGKASADSKKIEKEAKKKEKADKKKAKAQERSEKAKAQKAAKENKPKKVKEPKIKEKPLPKAPVILVILMSVSILGLVLLAGSYSGYALGIADAEKAYHQKDYLEAYTQLAGLKLKEKDKEFFAQTSLLAGIAVEESAFQTAMKIQRYEMALDSLVRGLGRYEKNEADAKTYGVSKPYKKIKLKMQKELKKNFKLSYKDAVELYGIRNRRKYSIEIAKTVRGLEFKEN
ncbi:MAG: hypothetical protein RRZ33_02005 [Lachnospiraceae bacterium]